MEFNHYREILDSMPMGVLFCDMDHIIRYMNPAAEIYYYETRHYKDLIGKNLFECHRPESKAAILALVEDMKNGGEARRIGTSKIEGYRIYMIPVRDKDGNMIGYIDQFEHP